ncbi:MAG: hypothetical protein KIS74_04350 [Burkholderiales bacterium]|nr:hypothetical protein [Burkholderiales bacterium]
MRRTIAAAVLILLAGAAAAQYPSPGTPAPEAAARPPAPAARIADVAWLQGYWEGEGLGGRVEDVWLPPKAGVLLGAFRLVKADGRPGFYELFAIEEVDDTLQFVVKHFNPDWVGWEEKDKALRIRLSRVSADEIAFGRIVFQRQGADGLVVKLAIREKSGEVRHETLTYRRKPL